MHGNRGAIIRQSHFCAGLLTLNGFTLNTTETGHTHTSSKSAPQPWARLYSDVFNPLTLNVLIVPVSAILIGLPAVQWLLLGVLALVLLGLLPYLFLIRRIHRNEIESIDIKERMQRIKPMLFSIGLYAFFGLVLLWWQPGGHHYMLLIVLCYGISAILTLIITRYWKISIHSACFTAFWVVLFLQLILENYPSQWVGALSVPATLSIVVMGIARTKLQVHTKGQVIGGFLFGVIVPVLLFYLFII